MNASPLLQKPGGGLPVLTQPNDFYSAVSIMSETVDRWLSLVTLIPVAQRQITSASVSPLEKLKKAMLPVL